MRTRGIAAVSALLAALIPVAVTAPVHAAKKPKIVYLTFDDGPNAANDPRLLRVLKRERVPATFFLLGQSLAADPAQAVRLWMAGHAVGNHSWSHPDLTLLDPLSVHHQFAATQRLLGPAGGACMRPPYGATNATVTSVARGLGLRQVLWTVDPQDWAHQDAAYIAAYVTARVQDKSIVLLHDGGGPRLATVSAVKQIIPQLRARGFEFRTLPACRVPLAGSGDGMAAPKRKPKKPVPPVPSPPVQPSPDPSAPAEMGS